MRSIFLLYAILTVFAAQAQRQKVALVEVPEKKYTVILETSRALILFNTDDLRAAWEANKEPLKSRGERYDDGVKGMAWLDSQSGTVRVGEDYSTQKQSEGAFALVFTITHGIGARLIRDGKTRVLNKKDGTHQSEIEYQLISSSKWSNVYSFHFPGKEFMFLKAEVVGEPVVEFPINMAPEYPGGISRFNSYVKKNARYSAEAKAAKTSGTVSLEVIILKDGTVYDVKVQWGVNEEFNQEAIRLVRESGKWEPGKKNSIAVNYRFTVMVSLDASGN